MLPAGPQDVYASAAHNHIELLLGCTSDEGYMLLPGLVPKFGFSVEQLDVVSARMLVATLVSIFANLPSTGPAAESIIEQYLGGLGSEAPTEDVQKAMVEFLTDVLFTIPTIRTATAHSRMCICVLLNTLNM